MKHLIKIYHPYWKWEEVKYNMWGFVDDKDKCLERTIYFMSRHLVFGRYMKKVIKEWKHSCEHNLTDKNQNRIAWIGQSACAIALKTPEDITRKAWSYLTEKQQKLANKQASIAIKLWETKHLGRRNLWGKLD